MSEAAPAGLPLSPRRPSVASAALGHVREVVARLFDPSHRLRARVASAKAARAATGLRHDDGPAVSFVLLSFNHRKNIPPIHDRLRLVPDAEIIVCEDGSIDGSAAEWLHRLDRPNEFLVRSNDIHEIRAYNRAIGLARGRLVCVLQDDDIPPSNAAWVGHAQALFARDESLAILGANQGWVLDLSEPVERIRSRAVFGYRDGPTWTYVQPIPTRAPGVDVPFMYVEGVSVGPIFYRREPFLALGGFDIAFSAAGEPGILFDHDICFRAWLAGWHVGVYGPAPFEKYVGGQGTFMFASSVRKRNAASNFQRIHARYALEQARVDAMTARLNAALEPVAP